MRKRSLHALLITAFTLCGATGLGQDALLRVSSPELAAAQGLAILRAMSTDKTRNTGFGSSDEAARAKLGTPIDVFRVELTALGKFKPDDGVDSVLVQSTARFYPVLLDGAVRSSVRVEGSQRAWTPARVGNTGLAVAIARAQGVLPRQDVPGTAMIQVLALNLLFVGQKGPDGWLITPVIDDPSVELKVGKVELAKDVFTRLAPIAARQKRDSPT